MIDVGANLGQFSKEFCRIHNGSCTVCCFEPIEYNFTILKEVMTPFSNALLSQLALSDRVGCVEMQVPIKDSGNLGIALAHFGPETHRDYVSERVQTDTLDGWIARNEIDRVDFIKCDVEGAELIMLKGARETLSCHHPFIYCEVCADYMARVGHTPADLFQFLSELGYASYRIDFQRCGLVPVPAYDDVGDYGFKARGRGC